MDAAGFLDSPAFAERRRAIEEAFRRSPVRPAVHAGGAYAGDSGRAPPADRRVLRARARVPGSCGRRDAGAAVAAQVRHCAGSSPPTSTSTGAGRPTPGRTGPSPRSRSADLFVILGTSHAGMPDPFAITLKAYETPLGAAPVDREFVRGARPPGRPDCLGSRARPPERALDRVPGGDAPVPLRRGAAVHDGARAGLVPARGRVARRRSPRPTPRAALPRCPARDHGGVAAPDLPDRGRGPRSRGAALRRSRAEYGRVELAQMSSEDRGMLEAVTAVDAVRLLRRGRSTATRAASAAPRRSTPCCGALPGAAVASSATRSGRIPRAR